MNPRHRAPAREHIIEKEGNSMHTIFNWLPTILLFFLGAGLLIREVIRARRARTNALEANGEAATIWQRIQALLTIALPDILTDAENKYPEKGFGELKMSHVITKIMELIPPEWHGRVKTDLLLDFIEKGVAGAKIIWDNLPRALASIQLEEFRAAAEAEKEATVPPAVVDELQAQGLHLELAEDGRITAVPDVPEPVGEFDPNTSLGVAEQILRHESARHGLRCEIAYVPAGEPDPQCEPIALRLADGSELKECCAEHAQDLCPVGHHWEPDGNGGLVAVLDAPTGEEEAPAAEAAQPVRRKRVTGTVQTLPAPEEAPAAE